MVLRRGLFIVFLAAGLSGASAMGAQGRVDCTAAQKAKAQRAAAAYAKTLAHARQVYFRTHRNAAQRRAFVRAQQTKVRKLRAAAACAVPKPPAPAPVPTPPAPTPPPAPPPTPPAPTAPAYVPTASSPCMLAQNTEAVRSEAGLGGPMFNEGPLNAAGSFPSRSPVNAIAIAIDFPDAPATLNADQATSAAVAGFGRFEEWSYGLFSVSVQTLPGWRRMARPASAYGSLSNSTTVPRDFLDEVTGLVDAQVDFSNIQFVLVVAPGLVPYQQAGNPAWSVFPGKGFTRDGNEIRHATVLMRAYTQEHQDAASISTHELGHSLGLPEAYRQVSGGTSFEPVGMWDPMSQPNPHHFLAWHKYRIGWLDQAQIVCVDTPRQVQATLAPVETAGGVKAVVVKAGSSTAYVVEARRKLGLDANLCKEGVLVYTVDSQVVNGGGGIEIRRAAEDVAGTERERCDTLYNAPFQVGQTYEDAAVKVTVVAESGGGYAVDVTRKG
jgi:M6 family metalloprotease-like protein